MTAKECLQRYLDNNREINIKLDEIQCLRELATKTTQTFTPDKVHSTASIVAKIVDLERKVDAEIDVLVTVRHQVECMIQELPDHRHRNILRLRYIDGKRWEDIAILLHYDYRYVLKLHKDALGAILRRTLNDT